MYTAPGEKWPIPSFNAQPEAPACLGTATKKTGASGWALNESLLTGRGIAWAPGPWLGTRPEGPCYENARSVREFWLFAVQGSRWPQPKKVHVRPASTGRLLCPHSIGRWEPALRTQGREDVLFSCPRSSCRKTRTIDRGSDIRYTAMVRVGLGQPGKLWRGHLGEMSSHAPFQLEAN